MNKTTVRFFKQNKTITLDKTFEHYTDEELNILATTWARWKGFDSFEILKEGGIINE